MTIRPRAAADAALRACFIVLVTSVIAILTGCTHHTAVGQRLPRQGDEIVVCGQFFHTGAPVVLWTDPGGYDAYRTERRFVPWSQASYEVSKQQVPDIAANGPSRFGIRRKQVDEETFERIRGGGWDLDTLRQCVDQFVYHYDVAGVSRRCFKTLQDDRDLSVQFMLDIDGTIYQTLDAKERAWQATKANDRSVGIEIANIGAYALPGSEGEKKEKNPLSEWYRRDENGRTRIVLPAYLSGKNSGVRTPNFVGHPARNEPIVGSVQGRELQQYDLTPQQYDSLIKLTATLCTVLPKITVDAPRDENGKILDHKLPNDQYDQYQGLLGHYHVQLDKIDPGPAFDWDRVINGTKKLMSKQALATNAKERGKPALPKNTAAQSSANSTTQRTVGGGGRRGNRGATTPSTTQPASEPAPGGKL
jgi:N-acetyl-anhydromuramyl-L-alanine amidase AmpD